MSKQCEKCGFYRYGGECTYCLKNERDELRAKLQAAEARAEAAEAALKSLIDLTKYSGEVKELLTDPLMVAVWIKEGIEGANALRDETLAENHRLQAEVARLTQQLGAHRRLILGDYVGFQNGGGPNECAHGIAAGIACRTCDMETFNSGLKALLGDGGP